MSEKNKILDIFGKLVEEVIINPSKQILEPLLQIETTPSKKNLLPETETAIFWDYENFAIPKQIQPEIFLEALFPSGITHRFITKRVYGNPMSFKPGLLNILKANGFTHIVGLETSKPNKTDHMMMPDCASFCTKYSSPLVVIIISGDIDFLSTIHKLSSLGHDIRLICQNKEKLNPILKKVVPYIIDRNDISQKCKNLSNVLLSLSQMLNYMISVHPKHALSIEEFKNEIEVQILQERLKTLVGHLQFLLKSPDYKWQYNTTGGIISNTFLKLEPLENYKMKKNLLLMKLGSESDIVKWEYTWKQFQNLITDAVEQASLLRGLYKACSIPIIRSRLQQKLFHLLETEQLELNTKNTPIKLKEPTHSHQCPKCKSPPKKFKTKKALIQHMNAVHGKKTKK